MTKLFDSTKKLLLLFVVFIFAAGYISGEENNTKRKQINFSYIPLADHYAVIIAYEKYAKEMKYADLKIKKMGSWPELKAHFMSGLSDVSGIICPMAMDMFSKNPTFRWVSLLHRDGNALAINHLLNAYVKLPENRIDRVPDDGVAAAIKGLSAKSDEPIVCGVPSLQSTHAVVLYKYCKDHNLKLGIGKEKGKDILAKTVDPPKSPGFLKESTVRGVPAAFEQSLPWADIVETGNSGKVGWYSKDVIIWPKGHVECIAVAHDETINKKKKALKEVIEFIHKAGVDIEYARRKGGNEMEEIVTMIRKHVPQHTRVAIKQSLRLDLNVINITI